MAWRHLLWAVALLGMLAVACSSGAEELDDLAGASPRTDATRPIVIPPDAPIVVGTSTPLTGPTAVGGHEDETAAIVAISRWKAKNGAQIQGHEIEVRAEDDGCTEADIAEQAATRLASAPGVVGVIGPWCSAGAERAIPIFARAGIVAISGSATKTDLATHQPQGGFFFRTAYRNDLEGQLIGLYATLVRQATQVWFVDDGEAYGIDLAGAASDIMEQNGVRVSRESVKVGAKDFSDLAARIKRDNPDLVAFAGFNPEAALLYRQLRDTGYAGVFGSVDAAASLRNFIEPVGAELAQGVLFAGCALPVPDDFMTAFVEINGNGPQDSTSIAQYADAATILLDGVAQVAQKQADGSVSIDPAKLRDAVAAASLPDGLSGSVAFDKSGDRVPRPGDNLDQVVADAVRTRSISIFAGLGLVPCQVQHGRLVNLLGPGAGQPQ